MAKSGGIRIVLLLLLWGVMSMTATAQESVATAELRQFVGNMERFGSMFPQEKVYLHFDNTGYFLGETIWFKAYVLRADENRWTDMSRVLYVELLTPAGDVAETCKLRIDDGQADGCFRLDKLLGSGYYEVRAYTRYMLNWGGEACFSRVFPIFDTPSTAGDYSKQVIDQANYRTGQADSCGEAAVKRSGRLNVAFYPEGGQLVEGLASSVAFEVTDRRGAAVETEGWLMQGEEKVAAVRTLREGRGVFRCMPTGQPLALQIDGRRFPLPPADREGCVMTVTSEAERMLVCVKATTDWQGRELGLVLLGGGSVDAFTPLTIGRQETVLGFDRRDMSQGVNQLALFDCEGHILAERMVFIYPHEGVDTVRLDIGKDTVRAGWVALQMTTRPRTTFSLAVRDYDTEVNGYCGNAATWLLLSSDLRGYVHRPEYYLESDDEEHRRAVDLLMMVQGWRCYDVRQMMTATTLERQQPIEDGLYLYGRIKASKENQNTGGLNLQATLYNRRGESLSGRTKTKADGSYLFALPDCEGEWTLLLDAQQKERKTGKIFVCIDRHFSPQARRLDDCETQPIPIDSCQLTIGETGDTTEPTPMNRRNHVLGNVTVKGRRRYSNARSGWENEQRGAYKASIYYNCDMAADEYEDRGEQTPALFEWLKCRNSLFDGDTDVLDDKRGWYVDESGEVNESIKQTAVEANDTSLIVTSTNKRYTGYVTTHPQFHKYLIHNSGLHYRNKPVIWILNNNFYAISQCPNSVTPKNLEHIMSVVPEAMPRELDQYKSVYISEDNDIWTHYVMHSTLAGFSPVTVFLYSHHEKLRTDNGLRHTHFVGYSRTMANDMPGHVELPPSTDFRRTLYWNPSIKTDDKGTASISFPTTPDCHRIVISTEGFTDQRLVTDGGKTSRYIK